MRFARSIVKTVDVKVQFEVRGFHTCGILSHLNSCSIEYFVLDLSLYLLLSPLRIWICKLESSLKQVGAKLMVMQTEMNRNHTILANRYETR